MEIRPALEAAGTDVFLDAATVRGLCPSSRRKDLGRCTFSGVVALSYAWVTPADPDPQRAQLQALPPVLVWWMCERARRKLGIEANPKRAAGQKDTGDATIQTADFGVFIDFMSMFQPDDTTGAKPAYKKPAEQASFGRALRNIGLLYGHAGTVVFKMTKTPLPPGGDADRVYDEARVVPPRAAPRRPRGAGDEQPRRLGVADGRGGARRRETKHPLVDGLDRRRSARAASCASRRRSSPRRVTTRDSSGGGHAGRADHR